MTLDNETINLLFKAIASLIAIIITGFVIPWLKNKIGEQKFARLEMLVEVAVRTAEQMYSVDEWKEKKKYALAYVSSAAEEIGLNISVETISNLVEATVNEIKYSDYYTKDKEY